MSFSYLNIELYYSKAPKSKTRQAKNRNETKETKVGRGIEPATGREERTGGDRKRQRN